MDGNVADLEVRLTAAEENIQGVNFKGFIFYLTTALKEFKITCNHILVHLSLTGLQMTDVDFDERITALEENGGDGSQNGRKSMQQF